MPFLKIIPLFVTPFAGVWIEIPLAVCQSCPTFVTPFAGVWIEILTDGGYSCLCIVTPFAGVWIEMLKILLHIVLYPSLPSRECGLKLTGKQTIRLGKIGHSLRGSVD